jgi:hypothetical protein
VCASTNRTSDERNTHEVSRRKHDETSSGRGGRLRGSEQEAQSPLLSSGYMPLPRPELNIFFR